jgi:hypothetical protein
MGIASQTSRRPTHDDRALAGALIRAVRGASTLEALAGSLAALGEAAAPVLEAAATRLDLSRLPRFGGEQVDEEGALSWDETAVLYLGSAGGAGLADLEIRRRPAVEPPPADGLDGDPATSAEALVRLIEAAQAREPDALAFEQAVLANAEELGVAIASVRVVLSPQHVIVEIGVPDSATGSVEVGETRRPRGGWASQWRQLAAELVAQIAGAVA